MSIAAQVLTGRFHCGQATSELEPTLAKLLGVKHAVLTPTARAGIYLTISSLIKPGQKVVLSPITIVDVINMVICAGGVPVFADVEPNTCNIDPDEVEKLTDKDTGAVLITHLHGLACDVRRLRDICKAKNIPLIEDAAQAFSTKVEGKWAGTFGTAGVFSFGMYKVVNSFLGGMIVTDDDGLAAKLREKMKTLPNVSMRAYISKVFHGFATDMSTSPLIFSAFTYWVFRYGYLNQIAALNGMVTVDQFPQRKERIPDNYLVRMSQTQARLIKSQLGNLEPNNRKRITTANIYGEGLAGIKELVLPPKRTDGSHIYTYYAFRAPDRHALVRFLMQNKRDLVISHYHNCASLEIFKDFYRPCPNAEATAKELLYLPTYPRYPALDAKRNVDVIQRYFQAR